MLKLKVNGNEITVPEDKKLMRLLRDDLKIKSVKDGCSEGACGTCTILVDGKLSRWKTSKILCTDVFQI